MRQRGLIRHYRKKHPEVAVNMRMSFSEEQSLDRPPRTVRSTRGVLSSSFSDEFEEDEIDYDFESEAESAAD